MIVYIKHLGICLQHTISTYPTITLIYVLQHKQGSIGHKKYLLQNAFCQMYGYMCENGAFIITVRNKIIMQYGPKRVTKNPKEGHKYLGLLECVSSNSGKYPLKRNVQLPRDGIEPPT